VRALETLLEEDEAVGRVFNVGSTEEVTILELARRVKALLDSDSPIEFIPYAQAYAPGFEDMQRRVPDISRIRALTGWQPRLQLNDILQRVAAWQQNR
jgi:UDP-glucose 4-epimerase